MEHTTTPWEYFKGNANGKGLVRIESGIDARPSGIHIASLVRNEESEANAAFIVKACNTHEKLVKIARAYRNLLKTMAQTEGEVATFHHINDVLAAAGVRV